MKLKLDLSLPKWVKLRVGLKLGLDVGAAIDVKLKLGGGDPVRWKLALAPGKAEREDEVGTTLGEPPPVARLTSSEP